MVTGKWREACSYLSRKSKYLYGRLSGIFLWVAVSSLCAQLPDFLLHALCRTSSLLHFLSLKAINRAATLMHSNFKFFQRLSGAGGRPMHIWQGRLIKFSLLRWFFHSITKLLHSSAGCPVSNEKSPRITSLFNALSHTNHHSTTGVRHTCWRHITDLISGGRHHRWTWI